MKKSYIKILTIIIFLIAITVLHLFVPIFNYYSYALTLILSLIALIILLGFEKSKHRFKKDILLNVLIYSTIYYLFTYFLGVFVGFLKSSYNLSLLSIIDNALPILTLIIAEELLRYELIKKGEGSKLIYSLILILFVLIDLAFSVHAYNFSILQDTVKFICVILFPSIAKNVMLTYLTYTTGYQNSIIYRLVFEIPVYFLPIFPDLGIYVDSILGIMLPAMIVYKTYIFIKKAHNQDIEIETRKIQKVRLISYLIIFFLFFVITFLTSGLGQIYAITIGTGSMTPTINVGDIVILTKLTEEEKLIIEEGEILAFIHSNKLVVHRIVERLEVNDEVFYYTKGDANENGDGYPISLDEIRGIVKFRVPYLGYPTVVLNELLERSK